MYVYDVYVYDGDRFFFSKRYNFDVILLNILHVILNSGFILS